MTVDRHTGGETAPGRGGADVMETIDVLSYTPLVFAGGVRSSYCASVIW